MTRALLCTSAILAGGGMLLLLAGRWLRPRWTAWASLGIALGSLLPLLWPGGPEEVILWEWLPAGGPAILAAFRWDAAAHTLALLSAGPALLLLLWIGLGASEQEGPWAPFLLLLQAGLLLLVMSANLLLAYAGWEVLILVTYFLLTFRRSMLPTPGIAEWVLGGQHLAGYLLLFAIVGIGQAAGTWDYARLAAGAVSPFAMLLLLATVWVRVAMVPFQAWAMGAAESPGPVSTLLLGGWGVLPGVYFWLRLLPLTAAPTVQEAALIAGTAGLVLGAALALRQESSRRIQAGDTVSRLGLVWVALGLGSALGTAAGLLLVLDLLLSKLSFHLALTNRGLDHPTRQALFLVGSWQALGLPPSFGFAGRWLLALALFQAGRAFYLPLILLAAPLTLAYLWRGWTLVPEGVPTGRIETVLQRGMALGVGLLPLGGVVLPWLWSFFGGAATWQGAPGAPVPLATAEGVSSALHALIYWLPPWLLLLLLIAGVGAWWSGGLAALTAPARLPTAGAAGSLPGIGLLQEPLPVLPQETGWLAWISQPTPLFRLLARLAAILARGLQSLVSFLERHTTYFLLVVLAAAAIVLIVLTR